jgi:hypothetical protein
MDIFTRESLAIEVGQSLEGEDVVGVLNRLKIDRGVPKKLFCDHGTEFTSQIMDLWAYQNGVQMDFSRPRKPTDNAFVESFNGTLREECLNAHWFASLADAKQTIEAWRQDYNHCRPHSSLGDLAPLVFAGGAKEKYNEGLLEAENLSAALVQLLGGQPQNPGNLHYDWTKNGEQVNPPTRPVSFFPSILIT